HVVGTEPHSMECRCHDADPVVELTVGDLRASDAQRGYVRRLVSSGLEGGGEVAFRNGVSQLGRVGDDSPGMDGPRPAGALVDGRVFQIGAHFVLGMSPLQSALSLRSIATAFSSPARAIRLMFAIAVPSNSRR